MKKISLHQIKENVFYVHNPYMQTAIASMWFGAGSMFDGKKKGIAHLFEHFLLQKTNMHKKDRYAYLESEGIEAYAHTYKEFSYVYHVSSPNSLIKSILLLQEGVFDVSLDQETLSHEKNVVFQEIQERGSYEKMWDAIYAHTYKDTSRGHCALGTKKSLDLIDIDDVKFFFKKYYRNRKHIYLFFTPQKLNDTIKKNIKSIVRIPTEAQNNPPLFKITKAPRLYSVQRGDTVTVIASFVLPKTMTLKEKSIAYLISSIFAGHWNSLLTRALRVDNAYTYWVYSSTLVTYREKSMHFYFDTEKKSHKKSTEIAESIFKDFTKNILTRSVLQSYIDVYITALYRESEDIKSVFFDIGSALVSEEKPLLPHEIEKYLKKVTPEDVQFFWQKIYNASK